MLQLLKQAQKSMISAKIGLFIYSSIVTAADWSLKCRL
jgi:hypothetical protein